jgi:beta-1,4-mannosyltransferase
MAQSRTLLQNLFATSKTHPFQVVDMFGCGLPVAAINFPALSELVRDGENGFVFETPAELTSRVLEWFREEEEN